MTKDIKRKRHKGLRIAGITAGCILCALLITTAVLSFAVFKIQNFQSLSTEKLNIRGGTACILLDRNRNEIDTHGEAQYAALDDIPAHTVAAFITSEDKRFYSHHGLDYRRMAKAALNDIKSREYKQGGSTISQQLIKNTHLSGEKTLQRKLEEIRLTRQLERKYTKREILEKYLNCIYFGESLYGLPAAARGYFAKDVRDLTLSESAMLAGIISSPNNYSPYKNADAAKSRKDLVLRIMERNGAISAAEAGEARAQSLNLCREHYISRENTYAGAALAEAAEILHISPEALQRQKYRIHTFFDQNAQNSAASAMEFMREKAPSADSLAVVIDNKTGGVCAFFGNGTQPLRTIKRRPGSAIKPVLVYAPALENNTVTPATVIDDVPSDFNGYKPENYGGKYSGAISVRQAVARSLNIPAVKVLEYGGIDYAKDCAQRAGIEFDQRDDNLAIALGGFTYGVTPLSLTSSYQTLANGGTHIKPSFISEIYTPYGTLCYRNRREGTRVFGEDTAYLMTDMLKTCAKEGTARKLARLPFEVAAKTGTVGHPENSSLNEDAWCMAYTSRHTLGVWAGASGAGVDNALPANLTGGSLPAEAVRRTVEGIYKDGAPPDFVVPPSIIRVNGEPYSRRFARESTAKMPQKTAKKHAKNA